MLSERLGSDRILLDAQIGHAREGFKGLRLIFFFSSLVHFYSVLQLSAAQSLTLHLAAIFYSYNSIISISLAQKLPFHLLNFHLLGTSPTKPSLSSCWLWNLQEASHRMLLFQVVNWTVCYFCSNPQSVWVLIGDFLSQRPSERSDVRPVRPVRPLVLRLVSICVWRQQYCRLLHLQG